MRCCKKKTLDKKPEPLVDYPDGGWGWLVCLAAFITQFIVLGTMNNFGVMYVALLREFKVGKAEAAWVGSITYGMMFLLGPLGTTMCKKIGCRLTTVIGCMVASGGCLLGSVAPNIYIMDLTYGLMFGVGASMCYFPSVIILGTYFNKRLSLANGLTSAGSGVGSLAMGPVLQKLLENFGMRNTMRISAGMLACIVFVSVIYRPINTPFLNSHKYETKHEEANKKKGCARYVDFSLFRNKAYLLWCFSLSFWMLGYFVPFVHLISLATIQGIDIYMATLLIGIMSVGSTVGRLIFGKIADHPKVNRLYLYQASFLMIGISNTICPAMTTYAGLAFYAAFFGFFEGCYVLLAPVLTGDIVGRNNMATGVGVLFAIKSVPLTLGPPIAGFIYDVSKSYELAFYISGAVPVIAACMMFGIPYLMPPSEEEDTKHLGKFEVILDECDMDSKQFKEDNSSGYQSSDPHIPEMCVEPPTPTLPMTPASPSQFPLLPPQVHASSQSLHGPSPPCIRHHAKSDQTPSRPNSVHFQDGLKVNDNRLSLNGSHLSINSILSKHAQSTTSLSPIRETCLVTFDPDESDHCVVRRSRVFELRRELSPSVFSLVRRHLDIGVPKQISAARYGGSIGCISVPGDAVPSSYSADQTEKQQQKEESSAVGKITSV